jgi:hypothetical protein
MPVGFPKLTKAARKYLERHAEPEATLAGGLAEVAEPYEAVVVIPAYAEHDLLLRALASVPGTRRGKPLVVLVVNQRDGCPDWVGDANRKLLETLRTDPANQQPPRSLGAQVEWLVTSSFDLVLIDRASPGHRLPERQGVGLARKIGADFALALWAAGGCTSPWIHCTDADVTLPTDYFDRLMTRATRRAAEPDSAAIAALLFDFRHLVGDCPEDDRAILQYEIYLRYYVLGLRSAGSPYAFHSIGSTLAIHANAYAQVRGFPRREAAEDFHLLAKLAKVGAVRSLRGSPILLSGRRSQRVPFGTGHAMLTGHARAQRGEPFPAHDPRSFGWLAVWLATLASMAERPGLPISQQLAFQATGSDTDPVRLERILDSLGVLEAARKALQNKGNTLHSLNESFDALATLRLIHALRDQVYPEIPLELALERAAFIDCDPGASLEAQRAGLAELETATDS